VVRLEACDLGLAKMVLLTSLPSTHARVGSSMTRATAASSTQQLCKMVTGHAMFEAVTDTMRTQRIRITVRD